MSAALQSPSQQPPLVNSAPIKPLLELRRGGRKPDSRLSKALAERFQHFHRKDKDVFREIVNVGQLVSLYMDGKQFLCRSPYDGSWGVLSIQGGDSMSQRALNVMNNLKQNLLTKWENSNPDILIRAGRNLNRAQSAAKAADVINNYYERQFYNHWFSQQEGLMGMTFGTYIDRYRFDDTKLSMSVLHDIFETKEASFGEGYGFCGDCQYGGTAGGFSSALGGDGPLAQPHCPQCASTAVTVEGPARDSLHTFAGQQEKQVGDLTCELLPFPACRFDLAKRPEESSWFIYRQRIPRGAITRVLGNVLLPEGGVDHDHGLEVLRALQKQGSAVSGHSAYGNQRRDEDGAASDHVMFDEMWLSPDEYADINLIGDEETVEGATIPKGRLLDVFPDGLCAVGLNGMAVVLALYPEKHRDHLVSGTWFMQAQTGAGRGLADSVEIQKQFNTLNNQAMAYMSATYTPAVGYDNQIWSGSKVKYLGTPRTNIPFDLTKLPEGRKLADSIYQFQPTAMPNQFFNYAQNFLNVMFQKTSMVTDFAQGEPGILATNTTATAAEIDQGNADAINQPIFLIKADARRRGAKLTVELFRKHFPMKRYFDLGGQYGRQQGIELSAADLCSDLVFDVARNSEMPKGPFQKQKNRMQFMTAVQMAGGIEPLKQSDPELLDAMRQEFDVDMELGTYDAVNELCLRRIGQMQEALKSGVNIPEVLISAIDPPISTVEKELDEKANWFADWLSTDDGQDAPMPLRAAAELLAMGQFQGSVNQQAHIGLGQGTVMASQAAPTMLGQAALEQQPESTEPDPSAQLQFAQEQSTQAHEQEQNALDREHELKVIDAEGARDKQVATHDVKEKIKLEHAKPKPKPAAKPAAKK